MTLSATGSLKERILRAYRSIEQKDTDQGGIEWFRRRFNESSEQQVGSSTFHRWMHNPFVVPEEQQVTMVIVTDAVTREAIGLLASQIGGLSDV